MSFHRAIENLKRARKGKAEEKETENNNINQRYYMGAQQGTKPEMKTELYYSGKSLRETNIIYRERCQYLFKINNFEVFLLFFLHWRGRVT